MKYIKTYNSLLERTIQQASIELNKFNKTNKSLVSIDDVLLSVEAIRLDTFTIFPSLINCKNLELALENKKFKYELRAKKMRAGELNNSADSATLLEVPIKFLMIYNIDSTDLETPNYLLVQRGKSKRLFNNTIELYYVQDDIRKFFDKLTTLVLSIKNKSDETTCLYKSSNAGEDWNLYKNDIIDNDFFKQHLDWTQIEELKKLNYIITVYFEDK